MKRLLLLVLTCLILLPTSAAELLIPGAGPPTGLLQALATAFNERSGSLRVELPSSSGMSGALDVVREGRAPLGRLPRQLTPAEKRSGLAQIVVAREPIVFVTGADVLARNLSCEQLAAIFSGAIADWRHVGGPPAPIRVFYREETAWTLRVIRQRLPEFAKLEFTRDGHLVNLDPEMTEQLQRYGWGVGWGSAGNVRAAKGLRVLALDGVVPSAETLRSGRYPLSFDVVLIHKAGKLTGTARAFVEFVTSPAGKAVIDGFGDLPGP